jgi:pimeloyl-ACP methyl ester carboxylesterase
VADLLFGLSFFALEQQHKGEDPMSSHPFTSATGKVTLRKMIRVLALFVLLALATSLFAPVPASAAGTTTFTGSIGAAAYLIEVPANWNGTLLLYSHGYVAPGAANPARDVGDPATGAFLLSQGYALAGSSYSGTGWAVAQAFQDQIALLDKFDTLVSHPKRTIAWGHSLGGMITAGLVQKFPQRFAGALPMCGVLAGGVGTFNEALDGAFAFKTLIAPNSALQVVHITNPGANLNLAEAMLAGAQATPQGRARIALVNALGDIPGWFIPGSPEPAATDYAAREQNQFLWSQQVDFPFAFAFRAELEFRAGGNPSWNTGVNYEKQLERSINRDEVIALYAQAGLDLGQDLATLANAPRISADPGAVNYLVQNIIFNGDIQVPVLTMHTTGDGLVPVESEQAYASVVRASGNNPLLRETFVHRAGHCAITPAETITALRHLVRRLDTGKWGDTDAAVLDGEAATLGPLNVLPPSFVDFESPPFLRPFDSRTLNKQSANFGISPWLTITGMALPRWDIIHHPLAAYIES